MRVPGIDYIDVQTGEIPDVAGRDRQFVALGRVCNQRTAQFQRSPDAARPRPKPGCAYGRPGIEIQNALGTTIEGLIKPMRCGVPVRVYCACRTLQHI